MNRLNKLNLLFKLSKKRFTNYNFHHEFEPKYLAEKNLLNSSLILFDMSRLIFYIAISVAVFYSVPLYMIYNRKGKHIDNPDYMLDMKSFTCKN